jgi:hypothetical protein
LVLASSSTNTDKMSRYTYTPYTKRFIEDREKVSGPIDDNAGGLDHIHYSVCVKIPEFIVRFAIFCNEGPTALVWCCAGRVRLLLGCPILAAPLPEPLVQRLVLELAIYFVFSHTHFGNIEERFTIEDSPVGH